MKRLLYNLATDKYKGLISAVIKFFLFLLSLIYGFIVRVLILFYGIKPYCPKCKVISVGNITLGGTGKTVLVEFISRYLKQKGHRVAILSRGYKRPAVTDLKLAASYQTMGDEPFMLHENLKDIPVIVDADRIEGANLAIRNYDVDTVVLDDGFQQWRLKKDLDIVVVNIHQGFGNLRLLPRGILRQPLSTLKRANIFVLNNTDLDYTQVFEMPLKSSSENYNTSFQKPLYCRQIKDILAKVNPRAEIFEAVYRPLGFFKIGREEELLEPETLKGKSAALVCGIANPDSFKNSIAQLGIAIALSFVFCDHHPYSEKDWEQIVLKLKAKSINTVVTTQKDAVRLYALDLKQYGLNIYVLRIELKIKDNEEGFYRRLLGIYSL